MRERKNENFNKLSDDVKMRACTEVDLNVDQNRSLIKLYKMGDKLESFVEKHNIPKQRHMIVYSPRMLILDKGCSYTNTASECPYGSFLPGGYGDWTDDDESFIVLYNKNDEMVYILNYETQNILYEEKIPYIEIIKCTGEYAHAYMHNNPDADPIIKNKKLSSIHRKMPFIVCAIISRYHKN